MRADNFYGECKIKTQNLISVYRKKYPLLISTAIAYNHESLFTPKNHLITTLFRKFNNSKNKKIKIFNPNEFRNVSHVYDFLPIFEKIISLEENQDFILANNTNYKLIEILQLMNKLFYKNSFIIQIYKRKKKLISRKADNTKINDYFNYNPLYDMTKILKRFNSYTKKNLLRI